MKTCKTNKYGAQQLGCNVRHKLYLNKKTLSTETATNATESIPTAQEIAWLDRSVKSEVESREYRIEVSAHK